MWAHAVGQVQAIQFPGTIAGVQAALDYCEAAGGGTVLIDSGANLLITTVSVKVPNRVRFMGIGAVTTNPTFTASTLTNVTAMVENKTQDGTQEYAQVEHIQVYGNKASGAVVGAGILFKKVYVPSAIKDCLVWNCSGNGIKLDGDTSGGLGEVYLVNNWVTGCNDHQLLLTGQTDSVYGFQNTLESAAAGKAQIKIDRAGAASAPKGHVFIGTQFEGTAAYDGVVLNECNSCTFIGLSDDGSGAANSLVKITGSVTGSDGAFAAAGHVFINLRANLTTVIDDQTAGVTSGNAQGRYVRWYTSPVNSATLDNSQIIGLQTQRVGDAITAAATITPGNGNLFTVNGNTNITAITAAARDKGRVCSFMFTGTPTVTDGGNIKLNGSFAPGTDDTLTLICDGTNWRELGRANSGGDYTVGGTLFQKYGSNIASATNITLPSGNAFNVTGTTTINTIAPNPTGSITRVVYLKFSASITIQDHSVAAGNIYLRGSASFYAIDTDVLTLFWDGAYWYEAGRRTIGPAATTTIASAATIAIPAYGDFFHVTGNTNITNGITVNPGDFGRMVVLIFDSTPTVSDTGTSKLNGVFVATADDTLTLKCDGTNWYECGRSPN